MGLSIIFHSLSNHLMICKQNLGSWYKSKLCKVIFINQIFRHSLTRFSSISLADTSNWDEKLFQWDLLDELVLISMKFPLWDNRMVVQLSYNIRKFKCFRCSVVCYNDCCHDQFFFKGESLSLSLFPHEKVIFIACRSVSFFTLCANNWMPNSTNDKYRMTEYLDRINSAVV